MSRKLRPGPGSLAGLRWLARVGPSPLDPWRLVMGWSEVAARSHARRLEDAGWLARYPMTRGDGSLFLTTRAGVQVLGLPRTAGRRPGPDLVGSSLARAPGPPPTSTYANASTSATAS